MQNWKRLTLSALLLTPLALSSAGCLVAAAAGATAGGVMYVKGDTAETVQGTPKAVTRAAVEAAKEMDLVLVSNAATAVDGKVVARTASDTKVVVVAKALGEQASSVSVRVGNFGDQTMQGNLLRRIKQKLKDTPTAPHEETTTTADVSD